MLEWSLDFAVPFAVIASANIVIAVLARHLQRLKITPEQHAILSYVAARGSCLRSELTEALGLDRERNPAQYAAMQIQAIGLADRGLVARRPQGDEVLYAIEPVGAALLEAAKPLLEDARLELEKKLPPGTVGLLPAMAAL